MKKKDYLILLLGIVLIAILFYKYSAFEYALILALLGVLIFIALIFFLLMIGEAIKSKKTNIDELYIYSCCFINDDVNFSKIYKIISRKVSNNSFKMKAIEFINYLKDKEILIKLRGSESLNNICERINFLLEKNNLDLEIKSTDIGMKDDNKNFIHNMNVITKKIREKGYELVQIYPASMYKKKEVYYFVIVSIDRLIDLGELGFLG